MPGGTLMLALRDGLFVFDPASGERTRLVEEFEAGAGNDQVKAVATGNAEIVRITIDPALLKEEGLEMVQDLVVAACNAALTKAREHVDGELETVTGGLKIPGMT